MTYRGGGGGRGVVGMRKKMRLFVGIPLPPQPFILHCFAPFPSPQRQCACFLLARR